MEIQIPLRGESTISMPMEYIIDEINSLPLVERFNHLAKIWKHILLNDVQDLTPEQWLTMSEALTNYQLLLNNYKKVKHEKK